MPGVACFCRVAENHWWSRVVRASRRSWLLTDVTLSHTVPLGCGVSVRAFAVILHSFIQTVDSTLCSTSAVSYTHLTLPTNREV